MTTGAKAGAGPGSTAAGGGVCRFDFERAGTAAGVFAVTVSEGVFTSAGGFSTGSASDCTCATGGGGNQKSRSLMRTRINAASSRASATSICRRCFCSESSPTEVAISLTCNCLSSNNGMTQSPPARGGDGPAA